MRSRRARSLLPAWPWSRSRARGARAAGRAPARVRRRAPASRLDAAQRPDRAGRQAGPAAGQSPQRRDPDRRPHPAGPRSSAGATRTCAPRDIDPLPGQRQLGHHVPGRVRRDEARRRHGRRAHRRGRRGLAGHPGRLGDGPRPRRLLRREVRELVRLAPALRCCSCPRSSTPGGRSGSCTSTCWCWSAASASRTSSSTRARSGRRSRSSTRCWPTSSERMLVAGLPAPPHRPSRWSRSCRPPSWSWASSCSGGFRIGLDLTSGRVGDVGYGSAVGATGIQQDEPLYVDSGAERPALRHLRAGQLPRLRPVRTRAGSPPSSRSQASGNYDLPAARAAAIVFDAADDHRAVPARPAPAAAAAPGACSGWRSHTAG